MIDHDNHEAIKAAIEGQQAAWEIHRRWRQASERYHASYSDVPGQRHIRKLPWILFTLLLLLLITNVAYAQGPPGVTFGVVVLLLASAAWGVVSYFRP